MLVIISEQIYMSWKRMEWINPKSKSSKLGYSIEVELYSSKLSGDFFFQKNKKDFPPYFLFFFYISGYGKTFRNFGPSYHESSREDI